jgi:hypothetical protein
MYTALHSAPLLLQQQFSPAACPRMYALAVDFNGRENSGLQAPYYQPDQPIDQPIDVHMCHRNMHHCSAEAEAADLLLLLHQLLHQLQLRSRSRGRGCCGSSYPGQE